MTTLYLVSLVVGGLLVGVSILGGDLDADLDADFGGDLDGFDADGWSAAPEAGSLASAAQFLSFRDIVFFLAFIGLTGDVLGATGLGEPLRAVVATGCGVGAAAVTHRLMVYLKTSESGAPRSADALSGRTARVLVDVTRTGAGKIVLDTGDQTVQLLALVAPEAGRDRFGSGDRVTVIQVEQGTARIAEPDFVRTA